MQAVAGWAFSSFYIGLASDPGADVLAPVKNPRDPEEWMSSRHFVDAARPASPAVFWSQATPPVLDLGLPRRQGGKRADRRAPSSLVLARPTEPLPSERLQSFLALSHQTPVDFERHMD